LNSAEERLGITLTTIGAMFAQQTGYATPKLDVRGAVL